MLTSFWFNHFFLFFFFPHLFVKQNFDHKTNHSYAEALSCEAMTSHETSHGRISLNLGLIVLPRFWTKTQKLLLLHASLHENIPIGRSKIMHDLIMK
jgi:hypothetical protein